MEKVLDWYLGLSHEGEVAVDNWLRENPPPEDWEGSQLDYAYHESPDGPGESLDGWGDS